LFELTKDTEYLTFSNTIAQWAVKNMKDEKGFFYYQKWPLFTNKMSYMRWGQAWMMIALSSIIKEMKFK
jgi:hypothetical protein